MNDISNHSRHITNKRFLTFWCDGEPQGAIDFRINDLSSYGHSLRDFLIDHAKGQDGNAFSFCRESKQRIGRFDFAFDPGRQPG